MARNAFIIIDMQQDFNVPGAPFRVDCGLEALPYIKKALEATRKSNVPVFHVFRYYRKNGVDCEITRYDAYKSKDFHGCTIGEKGAEILKRRNLSDCILFSTLEPCAMCTGALIAFNIKMVVFGAYDEQFGCLFSKTDLPKLIGRYVKVIGGICEAEAKALLNDFFSEHRN